MIKVSLVVDPISKKARYAIEGSIEEILSLEREKLEALNEHIKALTKVAVPAVKPEVSVPLELAEVVGERIHFSPRARLLPLRDQICLLMYYYSLQGKDVLSASEIFNALKEDGIKVHQPSLMARLFELSKEGHLIRVGKRGSYGYTLSRYGEKYVREIAEGMKGGES